MTITVCILRQQNKWVGHKFMGKCCMFFVQTPMCSSFWDSRRHHVLPRVYGFPSMSVNKWVCHTICHNISFGWIWKRRGYQWICQFNGAHENNHHKWYYNISLIMNHPCDFGVRHFEPNPFIWYLHLPTSQTTSHHLAPRNCGLGTAIFSDSFQEQNGFLWAKNVSWIINEKHMNKNMDTLW